MTVAELIAWLQAQPPDLPVGVVVGHHTAGWQDVEPSRERMWTEGDSLRPWGPPGEDVVDAVVLYDMEV